MWGLLDDIPTTKLIDSLWSLPLRGVLPIGNRILLRRLRCQEVLSFKFFGPPSGTIGGPWEEGVPRQTPCAPPPHSKRPLPSPSNTSQPGPPPHTASGVCRYHDLKKQMQMMERALRILTVIKKRETVKRDYFRVQFRIWDLKRRTGPKVVPPVPPHRCRQSSA